jgi:GT2 family glycosyltransferase
MTLGQSDATEQQIHSEGVMDTVSVVIPLYNQAATINQTVASVLSQSWRDFQLIVVDDGSTDEPELAPEYLRDPRLRWIRQHNQGVSAARNAGVDVAASRWIAFVDADDVWEPGHLASLMAEAAADDAVLVFSNIALQSRDWSVLIDPSVQSGLINDYFAFALRNGGYPVSASSLLVRRDRLLAAGSFPVGCANGEDIDTWCRLAFLGSFRYTGQATARYFDAMSDLADPERPVRQPEHPLFAVRLPKLLRCGAASGDMRASMAQYANFLLLEYVRQLLDRSEKTHARAILFGHCSAIMDPARYARQLLRIFVPIDRLSRGSPSGGGQTA